MKVPQGKSLVTILNNQKFNFFLLFLNKIREQEGETVPVWVVGGRW
jgi:hypothetical protein